MKLMQNMRRSVCVVAGLMLGSAAAPLIALANHDNEGDCKSGAGYYTQQTAFMEPNEFSRAATRGGLLRINADPNVKTAIIRSLYIFNQNGVDMVEFGWGIAGDNAYAPPGINTENQAIAFAARQIGGQYVASEGDSSNPGTGNVPTGTQTYRIEKNVPGDAPNTYYFYRDGAYFGRYYNPNLSSGGQPTGGIEGKGPCEDMQAHASNLQRKNTTAGSWNDWTGLSRFADFSTKWWYTDKTANPFEHWVKHCSTAFCADQ